MKTRLTFRYLFLAIGGRVSHEWHIQADYEYTEHPTFDLEGDKSNLPDIEETLTVKKITTRYDPGVLDIGETLTVLHVNDHTLGWDSGEIKFSELPDEHISNIVKTGLRAGRKYYEEQRKKYSSASRGAI